MPGHLKDRPLLLLLLRVMRVMLGLCAATLLIVGGAIYYSITSVQGRGLAELTTSETAGLGIICGLLIISLVMMIAASRILRQNT